MTMALPTYHARTDPAKGWSDIQGMYGRSTWINVPAPLPFTQRMIWTGIPFVNRPLLATIDKYGRTVSQSPLLYQALLRC